LSLGRSSELVDGSFLVPAHRTYLFSKSTQVFHEAYTPTTTFVSLRYSFSDFVDFSTVKENSFASFAFFNLDAFNVGDDHNVRAFRALYISLIWQCHSDLPWTALIGQQLTVYPEYCKFVCSTAKRQNNDARRTITGKRKLTTKRNFTLSTLPELFVAMCSERDFDCECSGVRRLDSFS
jgi:hypothetical protein